MYYDDYSCSYFSPRRYFGPFIWLISHLDHTVHLLHGLGVENIVDIRWRHQKSIYIYKPPVFQTGGDPLT